jgi:aryl-alcohol dehydrogenase-like predicted oxidoreductase
MVEGTSDTSQAGGQVTAIGLQIKTTGGMKYRRVGKSGLTVSEMGVGCFSFGDFVEEKAAAAVVHFALAQGINYFDTADSYGIGVSEEKLGAALVGRREKAVIATKFSNRMDHGPNDIGTSRLHIVRACEASLRRLKTDYIDLYQVHWPDRRTPIEETLRALDDLVRHGKVRYVGCSNLYAWQVVKANAAAEKINAARFSSGQYLYNLIARDIEREILPACAAEEMGVICWSPLGSGMLTGKYRRADAPDAGSRMQLAAVHEMPRYWHERGFHIVDELNKVSTETGVPQARLALAWLLHDARVSAVIVGSRSKAQLAESLLAGDWDIPEPAWTRLSEASRIDMGYPQQWIDLVVPPTFSAHER